MSLIEDQAREHNNRLKWSLDQGIKNAVALSRMTAEQLAENNRRVQKAMISTALDGFPCVAWRNPMQPYTYWHPHWVNQVSGEKHFGKPSCPSHDEWEHIGIDGCIAIFGLSPEEKDMILHRLSGGQS